MSRFCKVLLAAALAAAWPVADARDSAGVAGGAASAGVGRAATADEIRAWDIDVRPDLLGLPRGAGSVQQGGVLFAARCAGCHGAAGESNAIFTPLIGGTTADDVRTGHVAKLAAGPTRERTVFMKLPTLSSLFDYVRRAMPWSEPKSLTTDEVYGALAYMLHLAGIVPADFTLSDANMAATQALLPNRNGMSTDHGLWPGASAANGGMGNGGRSDVAAVACMHDCAGPVTLGPAAPAAMRKAQGSPAEQNRQLGPVRGTPLN